MRNRYADLIHVDRDSVGGRFLRKFWHPVCISERLPKARATALRIMEEDFTLYRGESGQVGLLAPRCPHRGTLLSVGRIDDDCLSCLYHGWKFNPEGQCVEQPAEQRSFAETTKIASYPTKEYHGLIFAYFGGGEPPEFPRFDLLEDDGVLVADCDLRPFPFFNQLENTVDEVHFNFVHRVSRFADAGLNSHIPELTCEETDYGIVRFGKRGDVVRVSHVVMPNCMLTSVPRGKGWSDRLSWRVPVDKESHLTFSLDMVHLSGAAAEEFRQSLVVDQRKLFEIEPMDNVVKKILKGEMHLDDVRDRPDLVLLQDTVAMRSQGIVDRDLDLLGASDRQVKLLREVWSRELRKIEQSGAAKSWKIRPELQTTRGV